VARLTAGWAPAARRVTTTNGVRRELVFGDTLANYVSGGPGYLVANPSVSAAAAVPEPASLALLALGLAAIGLGRRRKVR
jgi:hypothetical protein